jgi:hypothetical protein
MDTIKNIKINEIKEGDTILYYASFIRRCKMLDDTYRDNLWLSNVYKTRSRAQKTLDKKLEQLKPYTTII